MKRIIIILILISNHIFIDAQLTEELCQHKIHTFQSIANTGTALIIISVPTGLLGGLLMIIADEDYDEEDSDFLGEILGYTTTRGIGLILVGLGITMLAGGITLAVIGSNKVKKYQGELNRLKLGTYVTPKHAGITFTYRF